MKIVIPGEPIAKKRHRCGCRNGHGIVYDTQAKENERLRNWMWDYVTDQKLHLKGLNAHWSCPLSVSLSYYLPIPEMDSKPIKNAKLWGFIKPSHKPDIDNLIKSWDIFNGILWYDDSQIVHVTADKFYSENPCTIIEISAIDVAMDDNIKKVIKLFSPDEIDLLASHLEYLKNFLYIIERDDKISLENASIELIKFASDYGPKLAKLAKSSDK